MDPVAIVGLSCRFPGADSPQEFWKLLKDGKHAISQIPSDRWSIDDYYSDDPAEPGKMTTRLGGFLSQVDRFDASFFGISPREAIHMDPQQRLILEIAWEALESANLTPASLAGSQTSVIIGCGNYDYGLRLSKHPELIDAYVGTGTTIGLAANRLSYLWDLRGPSFTVETACSSSLVALHLACQTLNSRESDVSLVGAISLMTSPEQTITYSQANMMAPDGKCKTFDADADGYVRGEGCGLLVLKRLADALADQDNVLAIVRGTAVNQDGLSNGITAPNGPSQQAVIRRALERANVEPEAISYVEAHGTGTPLGDPIEIKSLKAVLGEGRSPEQPCWIGSVKTNIGHLEAAAGMAGLIKVILALQHRQIPPHLNLQRLNPYITLDGTAFSIPSTLVDWQAASETRLAGISSFGFGGTNAHVILEEPEVLLSGLPVASGPSPEPEQQQQLFTLSAKETTALGSLADRYAVYLSDNPEVDLKDVCFTANQLRSRFNHRVSFIAGSTDELRQKLSQFAQGSLPEGSSQDAVKGRKGKRLAFLFTGQGSQYVDMGRKLYELEPVFRATIDRCDTVLKPYLSTSLVEALYPSRKAQPNEASVLDQTAYAQPALFALECALFDLWRHWGVEPTAIIGHSVGEYAAAYAAGVFGLEDGLKLIAERARLMQALPSNGGMIAVFASAETVALAMEGSEADLTIAAFNGSSNTVVAGEFKALDTLAEYLTSQNIGYRTLKVSHAFHSSAMEGVLLAFRKVASSITYAPPQVPFISTVTGKQSGSDVATPDYWCQHIIQPVQFFTAVQTLTQTKCKACLEIGPKPILLGMAQRCLAPSQTDSEGVEGCFDWLPSLRPGQADRSQMLSTLGQLYAQGTMICWEAIAPAEGRRGLRLPTYPWQRQSYWVESSKPSALTAAGMIRSDSQQQPLTPLMTWLQDANHEQLLQRLLQTADFSAAEQALLPKFIEQLLSEQQQQAAGLSAAHQWCYEVTWQSMAAPQLASGSPRQWLILTGLGTAGVCELSRALQKEFEQRGQVCHTLPLTVSAEEIKTFCQDTEIPLTEIVWVAPSTWAASALATNLLDDVVQCCDQVVALVQALTCVFNVSEMPRLRLITQGAAISPSAMGLSQSPLWGLGKVIGLEYPEFWGGLIDIDPVAADSQVDAKTIALLMDVLLGDHQEDQIALKGGRYHVLRLVRSQMPSTPEEIKIRADATYLITGGLGSLGLHLAQWLVQEGARNLALLGRRSPSPEALDVIQRLQAAGTKVLTLQADVTVSSDLAQAWKMLVATLPPVAGVIHAAGAVDYVPLADLDVDGLKRVLSPKVAGGLLLHEFTKGLELDFFLLFSSIASVWGGKGQASYAAANQFLDALAHYRHQQGLPALSINWGPWAGGGMAVPDFADWMARIGIQPLPAKSAIAVMDQLIPFGNPQATVVDVDWTRFRSLFELQGPRPLFAQLPDGAPEPDAQPRQIRLERPKFIDAISEIPVTQHFDALMTHLQQELAQILGLTNKLPDPYQGFFEMGLDSLMAVELKTRLEMDLNCSLPGTLAFEAPTIHDLGHYLAENVLGWADDDGATDVQFTHEAADESEAVDMEAVAQLSEDEVEASIADRLARLENLIGGH